MSSFYEAITWDYVLVCLFSLAIMVLAIVYRLRSVSDLPNDNNNPDDNDSGGNRPVPDEPILDLPDGVVWSKDKELVN
jgi:hypothetical protein